MPRHAVADECVIEQGAKVAVTLDLRG